MARVIRNIVFILLVWVLFLTLVRYGVSNSVKPDVIELGTDFKTWHSRKSYNKDFSSFFHWLETGPSFAKVREVIDSLTKRASSDIDILNVLLTPIRFVWAFIQDIFNFFAWLVTGF